MEREPRNPACRNGVPSPVWSKMAREGAVIMENDHESDAAGK